ncbi:MAG: peptidoglycan DD-metalloendopeptidase family protein [Anaerolineales bacterium]|jgi:murein DD-endopeptidase MepM/ murein hydrolase activator NlpD
MHKYITLFILPLLLVFSAIPVSAQTPTASSGPIYIVQEGDTLWGIASLFNVSVNDIQTINNMTTTDIFVGDKLIIPGLEGLSGTLVIKPVPFGETLESLSRQYRIDPATLRKLNHIVSPTELYVGYQLIVLQQDNQSAWTARTSLGQGETMLELAVKEKSDPWTIAQINGLTGPSAGLPGDTLYLPSGTSTAAPSGLPATLASAEMDPLPLIQGTTAQIKVVTSQTVTLGGLLVDQPLHFFPTDANTQVALQGVNAMLDPGVYPLRLDVTEAGGAIQSFEQMVLVKSGDFPNDPALEVDPSTIDPAVTGPEDQWLASLTSVVTPEKYWNGAFQLPVASPYCIRAGFGDRRSYNGGVLHNFHTGIDFGVCSQAHPFDIYAAADGVVVFTGLKTVRGNATIVDNGEGVFTAYYHQSEIGVKVGDHIKAGQLIGKIGATGRVTGPHLHFEVWVNGIQVNPLQWLKSTFPH